jgi:hypothetical protein
MTAKETVLTAIEQLFGDRDPSAVDRWVTPAFIQHSSAVADGPGGLRQLVADLPAGFRYELWGHAHTNEELVAATRAEIAKLQG